MEHYVLDSFALLTFFRNEEGSEKVEQLLNDVAIPSFVGRRPTTALKMNWARVVYLK
jgi:PIN domain nuclease of toxin-antitoxin system